MLLINDGQFADTTIDDVCTAALGADSFAPHGDGAPSGASSRKLVAHVLANLERSHPAHIGTYALAERVDEGAHIAGYALLDFGESLGERQQNDGSHAL